MNPEKRVEKLTGGRLDWEARDFTAVLVELAKYGGRYNTPGHIRPDRIDLHSWDGALKKLWSDTVAAGREHGRVVLADVAKGSLVFGKTNIGTEDAVVIQVRHQPGRASVQGLVGSIHTHPESPDAIGKVFSAQDYAGFLGLPEEQIMVVQYGADDALLVMKTSFTPRVSDPSTVARRVEEIFREQVHTHVNPLLAAVEFNKAICVELGLVLYRKSKESGTVFRRIQVTR